MKMPRKLGNGKKEIPKDDPIYKEKRNKNNDAVKRSRQKTKVKAKETMDKVSKLKQVINTLCLILKPLHYIIIHFIYTVLFYFDIFKYR